MRVYILHRGFDGLRVNLEAYISPQVRTRLAEAKEQAYRFNCAFPITLGGLNIEVRKSGNHAFSCHTGECGAELYLTDPDHASGSYIGAKIDFRAFGLATGGLEWAEQYFEQLTQAFEIKYQPNQIKISRVDYATDFLAPWFVPESDALILPSRMAKREFQEKDTAQRFFQNTEVTGITCGHVANRQLIIYDKSLESRAKNKKGWHEIWNERLKAQGLPPLDMSDKLNTKVWRLELRVGSQCLRRRWEIGSFDDLNAMIGDIFLESTEKMRYALPSPDTNRSRWPDHPIWVALKDSLKDDLSTHRSGVVPDTIKTVHRAEHCDMLDSQILGLLLSRAAATGVSAEQFESFVEEHTGALVRRAMDDPKGVEQRLEKAARRYRFR